MPVSPLPVPLYQKEFQLGIFISGVVGGIFAGWLLRGRSVTKTLSSSVPTGKISGKSNTIRSAGRKTSSQMENFEWTDTSEGETDESPTSHVRARRKSRPIQRDCKMVMLVRMDLDMGKGKVAAQCAHSALGAYEEAVRRRDIHLKSWKRCGQAKIALKVPDESTLLSLTESARNAGLNTYVVRDAGRTQIAAGSVTVAAIGPADVAAVDKITGHLKLL